MLLWLKLSIEILVALSIDMAILSEQVRVDTRGFE